MDVDKLLGYIQSLQNQGYSTEAIKEHLKKHNYQDQQIENLFEQLSKSTISVPGKIIDNSSLTSKSSDIIKQVSPTIYAVSTISNNPSKLSRITSIISSFFLLTSLVYALTGIALIVFIILGNLVVLNTGLHFTTLKYFPELAFSPILLLCAGLWMLYTGFKIRNESRISFWMGLFSVIPLPLIVSYLNSYFISGLSQALQIEAGTINTTSSTNALMKAGGYINLSVVFAIIVAILLLISFKKFNQPGNSLSRKSLISVSLYFLLLVLPVISILGIGYAKALQSDYGYSIIQKQVKYKVYKPSVLFAGREFKQAFKIKNDGFGNQDQYISYTLGPKIGTVASTGTTFKPIYVKETLEEETFDVNAYMTQSLKGISPMEVRVRNAKDMKGYMIFANTNDIPRIILMFQMEDNVLIEVATINSSELETISFAESLS